MMRNFLYKIQCSRRKFQGGRSAPRLVALIAAIMFFNFASAQKNIAPQVTSISGSDVRTGVITDINNGNLGSCNTQLIWISTSSPPSSTPGVDWIEWEWSSTKIFDSITIHFGYDNRRFLTGGLIQVYDGTSWVTKYHFSGLVTATGVCSATVSFPPISAQRMRITSFEMTGPGQTSNPSFREIQISGSTTTSSNQFKRISCFESYKPMWSDLCRGCRNLGFQLWA